MFTVKDLFRSLREGRFTSLGCYPKYYVAQDGGILSHEAIIENLCSVARSTRDYNREGGKVGSDIKQWAILGCDVNWEDPALYCDHTGKRIESAYAEDEAEAIDRDKHEEACLARVAPLGDE